MYYLNSRLSGGVDTEWSWALEGRRVVPLMPRLVYPTPFTALATNVSKIVNQNPRICLNQTPVISAGKRNAYIVVCFIFQNYCDTFYFYFR